VFYSITVILNRKERPLQVHALHSLKKLFLVETVLLQPGRELRVGLEICRKLGIGLGRIRTDPDRFYGYILGPAKRSGINALDQSTKITDKNRAEMQRSKFNFEVPTCVSFSQ
jgi:hypothetical protein